MKRTAIASIAALLLGVAASAQEAEQPEGPLPTLDELLGTEGNASERASEMPPERGESELDRLLSGQEIADEFRSAVDLMDRSASRLGASRDTSVRTQRMQEDVLRKLDKLIADAENRSQQSSNSSSSSSNSSERSGAQPRQQSSPQAGSADNRGESEPPGLQTGPLRPEEMADLAGWGALPARLRDALLQGSSDRFSATYRKLTESYYRMLAEEPKQ